MRRIANVPHLTEAISDSAQRRPMRLQYVKQYSDLEI